MTPSILKPLAIALLLGVAPLSISTAYAVVAATGPAGPAGATGAKGDTGLTGPAGTNGTNGATGIQGLRGLAGTNGNNGTNGTNGATGAIGLTGPSGGVKGDTGSPGAPGPRGAAGTPQAGNNAGDMEYWDGSNWLIIPAPISNTGSLEFCNGVPGWDVKGTCIIPNTIVRSIGGNGPAGGKVFYVTAGGLHGLEAAPANQSNYAAWGCDGTTVSGAQGTKVGTGAANTAAIAAACPTYYDNMMQMTGTSAAKIADAYALNGYTDWFLPSKDELNLLYLQKNLVGGLNDSYYWSSSESSSANAWSQFYVYGSQINSYGKTTSLYVKAIRAF
jgi:hypothetical protein